MQRRTFRKNSFTLLELLIVTVIVGILVLMAVPQYQKMIWKARWTQAIITLGAIRTAEMYYYQQYGKFVNGIPGASGDYAATAAELNAWLENSGIDVVEVNEKAFEYFNYDVHVPVGDPAESYAITIKKSEANPDPYMFNHYAINMNLLSGQLDYNSTYYP